MVNKYVAAANFIGEKVVKPIVKKVFKPQKTTGTEVVKSVKTNVPSTRLEKATRDLKLATQLTKGSGAKLKQTQFEIKQGEYGDLTFDALKKDVPRNKKAKGGRIGYKLGSPRKTKLKKIQEAFKTTPSFMNVKKNKPKKRIMAKDGTKNKKATKFGMLSVKAGIDKDPNPTYADKIAGAKMKNKKKFV